MVADQQILNGMKAIRTFLNRSEATIVAWKGRYPRMPVRKVDGRWESNALDLNEWRRQVILELPPTPGQPDYTEDQRWTEPEPMDEPETTLEPEPEDEAVPEAEAEAVVEAEPEPDVEAVPEAEAENEVEELFGDKDTPKGGKKGRSKKPVNTQK